MHQITATRGEYLVRFSLNRSEPNHIMTIWFGLIWRIKLNVSEILNHLVFDLVRFKTELNYRTKWFKKIKIKIKK